MKKNRILNSASIVGLVLTLALISGCAALPEGGEEGTSMLPLLIMMALLFGVFYFIMIRPQRKRQKEHQQMMTELKKGDKVITAGGIYGVVESISEDNVVIKVESGATLRVLRQSVALRQQEEQPRIR